MSTSQFDLDTGFDHEDTVQSWFDESLQAPVTGTPTIASVLGSRLKALFKNNYSAGTWTDDVVGKTLSQATSGNRPTTTTLPDGATVGLVFDGVNDNLSGAVGLSTDYNSEYTLIFGVISTTSAENSGVNDQYVVNANAGSDYAFIIQSSAGGFGLHSGAPAAVDGFSTFGANGTSSIADGTWRRFICLFDGTATPHLTLYINGSSVGSVSDSGNDASPGWNAIQVGMAGSNSNTLFKGSIGVLGFAASASTFSGTDITSLDTALAAFLTIPVVGVDPMGMLGFFGI